MTVTINIWYYFVSLAGAVSVPFTIILSALIVRKLLTIWVKTPHFYRFINQYLRSY